MEKSDGYFNGNAENVIFQSIHLIKIERNAHSAYEAVLYGCLSAENLTESGGASERVKRKCVHFMSIVQKRYCAYTQSYKPTSLLPHMKIG